MKVYAWAVMLDENKQQTGSGSVLIGPFLKRADAQQFADSYAIESGDYAIVWPMVGKNLGGRTMAELYLEGDFEDGNQDGIVSHDPEADAESAQRATAAQEAAHHKPANNL